MDIEHWKHRWSESNPLSYTFNTYSLYEPVNSISAFIMSIYTLYTLFYTLYLTKKHNNSNNLSILFNKNKQNIYFLYSPIMTCIFFNLLSSFIAHATYNSIAISIDEMSIIIGLIYYVMFTFEYAERSFYIIMFFLWKDYIGYIYGFTIVFYDILIKFNKQPNILYSFKNPVQIFTGSLFLWVLDQQYHSLWFIYGHALFHIGFVYSIEQILYKVCIYR